MAFAGNGKDTPSPQLPSIFRKNEGQWNSKVLYQGYSNGSCISFLKNELSYAFQRPVREQRPEMAGLRGPDEDRYESLVWNVELEGSNRSDSIHAENPLSSSVSYMKGASRVVHATDYSRLTYVNIYHGVDLQYYVSGNTLKYDFLLRDHADLSEIKMKYKGVERIRINEAGDLIITTAWGDMQEAHPFSYQIVNGEKKEVTIAYELLNDSTCGFHLNGKMIPGVDLVIDPVILQWSTFVGGPSPGGGYIFDIALDPAGNIYGCGWYNAGFPTTPGSYHPAYHTPGSCGFAGGDEDAYVWKMNSGGTALIWATYIGGSCRDRARGLALDPSGNVYLTGWTESTDFPTVNPFQPAVAGFIDAFAAKFDPTGTNLLYCTYLGGNYNDWPEKIAVNAAGEAFLCGSTLDNNASPGFPTTPGSIQPVYGGGSYQADAYLTKLNAAGNGLVYSTYLGGTGWDWAYSIRINAADEVFLTGKAQTNFPTTPGSFQPVTAGNGDVFVSRINAAGSGFIYSTFIGGANSEVGNSIVINAADEAFITGNTSSTNYPCTAGAYDPTYNGGTYGDCIVSHLNATGTTLLGSTYLGSPTLDIGWGIDVDANNNIFVAGYTDNTAFPTTPCAYDRTYNGSNDADYFIVKFNPGLNTMMYGTYVGGNGQDYWEPKIKLVGTTCNQMAICSGTSHSPNFPTTSGSFEPNKLNGVDDQPTVYKLAPVINPGFTLNPPPGCSGVGVLITFHDTTTDCGLWGDTLTTHHWNFGDGTFGDGVQITHSYSSAGTYTVTLTVGCPMDSIKHSFTVGAASFSLTASNTSSCSPNSGTASVNVVGATPPLTYSWSPSGGNTAIATGLSPGTYTCTVTDANGCGSSVTTTVNTAAGPTVTLSSQVNESCFGAHTGTATVSVSAGTAPYTYSWSPSGGNTSTGTALSAGTYSCTVNDGAGCIQTETVLITQPSIISVSQSTVPAGCGLSNGSATVSPSGGTGAYTYSWSPAPGNASTLSGIPAGTYTCTVNDANGCSVPFSVALNNTGGPVITLSAQTGVLCHGNNNGSATFTATGGTTPYTYSWSPSGGNSATASGLGAGTYTCSVTDATGCFQTQTVVITQPAAVTVAITGTHPACGLQNGSATATSSGGTGAYTYSWTPAGGSASMATGLGAGIYTCTVIDANGCTIADTILLSSSGGPAVAVSSQTNVLCNGGNTGQASVAASGGTGPYTYSWSPSGGNSASASGLQAGSYTCTVIDAGGCSQTQSIVITQPTTLLASSSSEVVCGLNNGSAGVAASGGQGPYTYSWSPSGGNAFVASGLSAGNYTCIVTDANGCTASTSIAVVVDSIPLVSAGSNITIQAGESTVLDGSGTGIYLWTPASGLSCTNCPKPLATPSVSTSYCLRVTGTGGCADSSCVEVTVDRICGEVFVPNFFSPNGDGKNDVLCVYGNCIKSLSFIVYDRWGEKVFETADPTQCWNGVFRGELMNSAVFVYFLRADLLDGSTITKKGNVTLER